jgi:hypothetical protein
LNDEDETEKDSTDEDGPQKWSWIEFWSLMLYMVAAYFKLWAVLWDGVAELLSRHRLWRDEREKFQERAAIEIEALTKDPAPAKAD